MNLPLHRLHTPASTWICLHRCLDLPLSSPSHVGLHMNLPLLSPRSTSAAALTQIGLCHHLHTPASPRRLDLFILSFSQWHFLITLSLFCILGFFFFNTESMLFSVYLWLWCWVVFFFLWLWICDVDWNRKSTETNWNWNTTETDRFLIILVGFGWEFHKSKILVQLAKTKKKPIEPNRLQP